MSTVIDFRKVNQDPFYVTRPNGPPAAWKKDVPATYFFKPYGRAIDAIPNITDATLMISPNGAPMMSERFVLPDHSDLSLPSGRNEGLSGFWSDNYKDFKNYSISHPAATMVLWGGIFVLAIKMTRLLK